MLTKNAVVDYDSIFPFVNKPSRYIGNEWNSVVKPERFRKSAVGLCLCFPDLYETGFSNMGVEILYRIVNSRDDAFAERVYSADLDLGKILSERGWSLFSLETRTPLADFDILGFTLPYELCYTNILEVLNLSGIPLYSAQRDEKYPLIIGGGPCVVNPEPLADFFDAFLLGDGEEAIGEIIDSVADFKKSGGGKSDLLLKLARIPGVYVPSLYDVEYNADGTLRSLTPKSSRAPGKIAYRQVDLGAKGKNKFSFPVTPIVPFVQTVHDRLNVEIQRGCPNRCRFCQAGYSYHSYRERDSEELESIVEEGLRSTGYDAVTLSGLSASNHSRITQLLKALAEKLTPRRISIGLPSTRADKFSLFLAEMLQTVRRQSLTFAPEAGSDRLRRVIRKEIEESEIRETLKMAFRHGWKSVKFYFMYGLPTEKDEDLEAIAGFVRSLNKDNPGLALTITLSPFVPKPHTPFQWHRQDDIKTLNVKLNFLRSNLRAQVRAHGIEQILVEGVLSRGDRRCSKLLEEAWKMGAKFDEWGEKFRFDLWKKAFEVTGCTPEFYCHRERNENEVLPWDHLEGGPDKKALWADYKKALEEACNADGVPSVKPEEKSEPPLPVVPAPGRARSVKEKTLARLRFKISRRGSARFLSHLEQIEMVRRVLRRADLPMAYTSGFHPQMKCSFGPAISVGYESECEFFDADFCERVETENAGEAVRRNLPAGFALARVSRIPVFFPSLESLLNRVDYEVFVSDSLLKGKQKIGLSEELTDFLKRDDIALEKVKNGKNGLTRLNIPLKPLIVGMEWFQGRNIREDECRNFPAEYGESGCTAALSLKFGPGKNVKPERIIALLLGCPEEDSRRMLVMRRAFYIEKPDGSIAEP